jgi:hypothetical protein
MHLNEQLVRLEHENQRLAGQARHLKATHALILTLGGATLLLPGDDQG